MTVLGDHLTRDKRTTEPALSVPNTGRQYDYRRFCTTAWKVGNLLHHFGVRAGASVAISGDNRPEPLFAVLGTALLGGVVRFGSSGPDTRVLVAPTADLAGIDRHPGCQRIGYGEQPDDPSDAFFEGDVWSENPTKPPAQVTPEQPVVQTEEGTYTHDELLRSARAVVDRWNLTAGDVVAVRAPLRNPETIVAGVVAPLLACATILFPDDGVGDCAVAAGSAPEPQVVAVREIE